MVRIKFAIMATIALVILVSCATHPDYATQFRFPIESGSIENGQATFVGMGCVQCHTVKGVDLPAWKGQSPVTLELGGDLVYAKTYADLVTSIINPRHAISEDYLKGLPREERRNAQSPMPFNDQMTVSQLIDLVKFLNSRYILIEGYEEVYLR